MLLYHLLRYERFLRSNRENPGKMERLLSDYREISRRLSELRDSGEKSGLYVDLIELINRIADYEIPKDLSGGGGIWAGI